MRRHVWCQIVREGDSLGLQYLFNSPFSIKIYQEDLWTVEEVLGVLRSDGDYDKETALDKRVKGNFYSKPQRLQSRSV